jgi:hypothetical protein
VFHLLGRWAKAGSALDIGVCLIRAQAARLAHLTRSTKRMPHS